MDPLESLLPALLQSFTVILAGYLAGRFNIVNTIQAKGIGTYVTQFALPAVLFRAMVTIDFGDVSWNFILAVSVAKAVLYGFTLLVAMLLTRPFTTGPAGLLATFTTQSNDVALGYPILLALYPNYAKYIYLFAPAQLIFLNPMSFILMEWHRQHCPVVQEAPHGSFLSNSPLKGAARTERHQVEPSGDQSESSGRGIEESPDIPQQEIGPVQPTHKEWRGRILLVIRNVCLNPLVFMTLIGVIFNFILNHKLPLILDKILEVFANSFFATALFYLGVSMVGKVTKLDRKGFYIVFFIVLAKLVISPLLTREIVAQFHPGKDENETLTFSTVGFLYGCLPTAPPVFLFASQYGILTESVAAGLVICTFISAPIMYISAWLVTLPVYGEEAYDVVLSATSLRLSIISLVCTVWVWVVFILSRRVRRIPHSFTNCLLVCIVLNCLGMTLEKVIDDPPPDGSGQVPATWRHYLQFTVFFTGVVGARCWTCLLALALALLKMRSLCFVVKHRGLFYLTGFCLPVLITGILLMSSSHQRAKDIDPAFQYGRTQIIVSLTVLIVCIIVTSVSLVLQHRYDHHTSVYLLLTDEEEIRTPRQMTTSAEFNIQNGSPSSSPDLLSHNSSPISIESDDVPGLGRCSLCGAEEGQPCGLGQSAPENIEAWLTPRTCPPGICRPDQTRQCTAGLERYRQHQTLSTINGDPPMCLADELQLDRHTLLVILLLISMVFGFFLCLWRLIKESVSGIYIELEFLDSVFNFGQGFIAFSVFGFDMQIVILPFIKRLRKLFYGAEVLHLPDEADLQPDVIATRLQFKDYHLDACRRDIVRDVRWNLSSYRRAFPGSDLVDWLIRVGLATDRPDAVAYGNRLLLARVIQHVMREVHFADSAYIFFRFHPQYDVPGAEEPTNDVTDIEDIANDRLRQRRRVYDCPQRRPLFVPIGYS